jgi:protein involved in polysaccharide export with SLBB domain
MHRLVTHALCSIAALATLSGVVVAQASDPAAAPLRIGDRILIKVWVDTTFSDSVRIDETGSVVLPRLGSLCVRDIPASTLADSVRRAYGHVIRADAIEVTPLRRVTVLGEVRKPGTYFVEPRSMVRDAIAAAGGMTDISAVGRVTVMRDSSKLAFKDWQRRDDALAVVRSGDVMWVDREAWLKRNVFSVISGLGVLFTVAYTALR